MIHALVDDPESRNIIGVEYGNRQEFDNKHAGDIYWFFIDTTDIYTRTHTKEFFKDPREYLIDSKGYVTKRNGPIPPLNLSVLLIDDDGAFLFDDPSTQLTDTLN